MLAGSIMAPAGASVSNDSTPSRNPITALRSSSFARTFVRSVASPGSRGIDSQATARAAHWLGAAASTQRSKASVGVQTGRSS